MSPNSLLGSFIIPESGLSWARTLCTLVIPIVAMTVLPNLAEAATGKVQGPKSEGVHTAPIEPKPTKNSENLIEKGTKGSPSETMDFGDLMEIRDSRIRPSLKLLPSSLSPRELAWILLQIELQKIEKKLLSYSPPILNSSPSNRETTLGKNTSQILNGGSNP